MTAIDMRNRRGRLVAVLAVVLIACAALSTRALVGNGDQKLILTADFTDVSPLLEGNDVRIKGVLVGTIASIRQSDRGAKITMELNKEALPVHDDATATIRPVSLLGERYIELDPGSPERPVLRDGQALATKNVTAATDLDEVLNVVDADTGDALAALVATLGQALDGNGEKVEQALSALAPAMRDTEGLTEVLRQQNTTINDLVTSLEKVAGGVGVDDGDALDRLVGTTRALLHTTSVNEAAFRRMVAELPTTLASARKAVGHLQSAAAEATPTLRRLRPLTDDLTGVSSELRDFADAADPALEAANPVLAKAEKLLDEAQPVAALLQQLGPDMRRDLDHVDAITARVAPEMTMIMEFVRGWALTTNGRDALGHYFRAGVVLDEGTLLGVLPGKTTAPAKTDPTTKTKPPKNLLDGLLGKNGLLGEDGLTNQLLGGLLGLPDSLLSKKTDRKGGVTGLSDKQEINALQFLLGGK